MIKDIYFRPIETKNWKVPHGKVREEEYFKHKRKEVRCYHCPKSGGCKPHKGLGIFEGPACMKVVGVGDLWASLCTMSDDSFLFLLKRNGRL